ncbi:MAG: hypothetical protein JNL41_11120 [Phenylobacterium sp.]|uniref:hypothetical protein n=1 Tax=Phenylobacterium sp. TaxID=1871053 RepID=UPI001A3933D2|nr:hypothetical protein [Phenylobacterium sp.]MBL8554819.1 hypothetical protein [Phenylobacterium sp.]
MSAMDRLRRVAVRALGRGGGERRLVAQAFDRDWYLTANPDVAATRADPLDHFLAHGWREGRDPTPRFSVDEYLENNPDIAAAGLNPFVHWLKHGRHEGRPMPDALGFRQQVIRRLKPIDAQIEDSARATAGVAAGTAAALAAALGKARHGLKGLHITFSHDDYRARVGGVQLCLHIEAAAVAGQRRDHLQLHPAIHWPVVRAAGDPGRLEAVLNGQSLGVFTPADVAAALPRAGAKGGSFAIHSLLGHEAAETAAIVEAAGLKAGFLWLHDYASLCAGFHLLRDGVEDCAAPPPGSGACAICVYGPARARHADAHATLFARLELTVVSPAQGTLDFWRAHTRLKPAAAVVHPHARLTPRGPAPTPKAGPLRVAYAGHPAAHKGWPIFRDLALRHEGDRRYQFLHLGAATEAGLPMQFHDVRVGAAKPHAMREALERLEIDVLVFWPLWRETFSFLAYEALAAGAAILTGPDSGNVAALVGEHDAGLVVTEAGLAEAFDTGAVAQLSRAVRRPMLYDLAFSGMTADLASAKAPA